MSVQVIAPPVPDEPARGWLSWGHPLFEVAARHCDRHGRTVGRPCGKCWERAIRDDERIVAEHGLPREITPDPFYIDEVAVRKACRGEKVKLTPVERAEAMRCLAQRGYTRGIIATLLGMAARDVDPSIPRSPASKSGRSLSLLSRGHKAVARS